VGVDDERAPAGAAAKEVMAGVANNQTDIVLAGKIDTGLDMFLGRGRQDIDAVVAERARGGRVLGGTASLVGEVCPESGTRLLDAEFDISVLILNTDLCKDGTYCHCSSLNMALASAQAAASYELMVPRGPSKVLWHTAPGGTWI